MSNEIERIHSRQNPRIKNLVKLRDRKHRDKQGCFLIEGHYELQCALDAGVELMELYMCPDYFKTDMYDVMLKSELEKGIPVFQLEKNIFDKVCYRDGPDGLIGVARTRELSLLELKLNSPSFVLVVEKIEKPGNLGNLLRSADAAGVDAVIVCDAVSDIYNPNIIRASRGLVFNLPIALASNEEAMDFLHSEKLAVLASTPAAKQDVWGADLSQPVAIVAGSESDGLSDFWLQQSDMQVKLPIKGSADSLNVGMATAVILYEVLRQRA